MCFFFFPRMTLCVDNECVQVWMFVICSHVNPCCLFTCKCNNRGKPSQVDLKCRIFFFCENSVCFARPKRLSYSTYYHFFCMLVQMDVAAIYWVCHWCITEKEKTKRFLPNDTLHVKKVMKTSSKKQFHNGQISTWLQTPPRAKISSDSAPMVSYDTSRLSGSDI